VHEVNVEKTEVVEAEIDKEEENRKKKGKSFAFSFWKTVLINMSTKTPLTWVMRPWDRKTCRLFSTKYEKAELMLRVRATKVCRLIVVLKIAHCYWLAVAAVKPKAPKISDNPLIRGLGSFKVTYFGINRKLIVDFVWVIIQHFSLTLTAERKYV